MDGIIDQDPITPVHISHNSEQIWNRDRLEQNYNYLVYEFETEEHSYEARTYLDEIDTVVIFGPWEKNDPNQEPLVGAPIDDRILTYFRRRYAKIERPGENDFLPVA
jgi:hypothetical protein